MSKIMVTDLVQIFKSSVSAVKPDVLIRNVLKYCPSTEELTIAGKTYNMKNRDTYLVGAGKAVRKMAIELEKIMGSKIKTGILSIPEGSMNIPIIAGNIEFCEGAKNNLPDENALATAVKINNLISGLGKDDLLLVLISGGGSSLLPMPQHPITLREKVELIRTLANSGADIKQLNTVRKRISELKGGQLAIKAQPAEVVALILSDIVNDYLDLIASGPTVENKDHVQKAIEVLESYKIYDNLNESFKHVLKNETVQPFPHKNVSNHLIGSNKLSIAAAVAEAKKLKYLPLPLSSSVTGNVKDVAKEYTELTKLVCLFLKGKINEDVFKSKVEALCITGISLDLGSVEFVKGVCLILGGEITVEVNGKGKGGRNQQLALEFSNNIQNMKNEFRGFEVHLLSAGTDGADGPTDAAGAIGYLNLIEEAKENQLNANEFIDNNDSYNFYRNFKDGEYHVITGPTDTNVMDIHLILITKAFLSRSLNLNDNTTVGINKQ